MEAETYKEMTAEELIEMLQVLFPHFNSSDREAFLYDIQEAVSDKFSQVWEVIKERIDLGEQEQLIEKLCLLN